MNGASVVNEVEAGPGVAGEEFGGQQVAFQAITGAARSDEIAWRVDAALSQGKDVIDCRDVVVERSGAIHAAPSAITHHGVFDGAPLVGAWDALRAFRAA